MHKRRNNNDEESDNEVSSESSRNRRLSEGNFKDLNINKPDRSDSDNDSNAHMDDIEANIDKASVEGDDDVERLKNRLLFSVQGLGSTKDFNQLDIYVKGPHCEDSLKDILKLCDEKTMFGPGLKIELGKWEVLQKDLIPLLVTQHQDKKLTFYLLALLVELTSVPSTSEPKSDELISYLQVYFLFIRITDR